MIKMLQNKSALLKVVTLALAFVLVAALSVGGTLAWLTAKSDEVKNTFTSAELFDNPTEDFTLWEHMAVAADDGTYTLDTSVEVGSNTYDILPGVNIPKDPTVDIEGLQEYAYLYIKVTGSIPGVTYSIDAANWTQLGGHTDVWVYSGSEATSNVIKATDENQKSFTVNILTQDTYGNAITVPADYNNTTDNSTLTFNAYMVQATGNGANAAQAWANTYGANP